jgi:uncharacterized Zn-finger protein
MKQNNRTKAKEYMSVDPRPNKERKRKRNSRQNRHQLPPSIFLHHAVRYCQTKVWRSSLDFDGVRFSSFEQIRWVTRP